MISYRRGKHVKYNNEGLENIFFESVCKLREDYYFMQNISGRVRWSPKAVNDFELPGEYVDGFAGMWRSFIHPEDLAHFDEEMERIRTGKTDYMLLEYRVRKRNGEYVRVRSHGVMNRDTEISPVCCMGILERVDDTTDELTHVPNIYVAVKDIADTFENENASGCLMIVGIDDFKRINDLYTYSGGDEIIKNFALQISKCIPQSATLYRLEGDQFAVHYPYGTLQDMKDIYARMVDEAMDISLSHDIKVSLQLSAGVCKYPDQAEKPDILRKNVRYAFERAKRQGKGQLAVFTREIREQYLEHLRLIEELKRCVRNDFEGFELYYQPIVEPKSKQIVECEALLRWKNGRFPGIGPAKFIPILEETGMMKEVGAYAVRTAISQVMDFSDSLIVNVNVSYKQLKDDDFAEYVLGILKEYQFPPERLMMELTESCKAHDLPILMRTMNKLREHRVLVALDDFGTGYASLDILQDISVDCLKIEQCFVAECEKNNVDRNIIKHIILLAHSLGLKVCMEGVETEGIYDVAVEEQADILQGYYFSRPVPAGDFQKMLRRSAGHGA